MATCVHVVTSDRRRGAEVQARSLVGALTDLGADVRLLSLQASGAAVTIDAESLGARPTRHPATLLALRRRLRGASAVVGHGGNTLSACVVAALGTGLPLVYVTIGDPRFWRSSSFAAVRTRALLRRASIIVTLYADAAGVLAEHGLRSDRLRVIPPGFDPAGFPLVDEPLRAQARARFNLPLEAPVVAYVGSLTWEKNPLAAVRAMPPDAFLVLVGDGPLTGQVCALAGDSGLVRVLGPLCDTRSVYAAADAVVLPSRTEGLPGVAIEAALSGVPVVATDVGGTREAVADGVTGVLVAEGDETALRAAIREVLTRPGLGGVQARDRAIERFSLDRAARDWMDLLRTIEHS